VLYSGAVVRAQLLDGKRIGERLSVCALRCERLIRAGEVAGYAELVRLGRVTAARISQIMNLLLLAPDIQEAP
jgi:hypothetical protein